MKKDGSVLILSLWMLALLACLAAAISYQARIDLQLSRYAWDEIRLLQMTKMAAQDAVNYWKSHSLRYASLNQPWSHSPYFENHALGDGSYTAMQGSSYGLEDECGRLNLNTADPLVLTRLFGRYADRVPAIIAWRSPSGKPDADYAQWGYAMRHGPFKSVDELLLVKGMTPEVFNAVNPFLSVDTDGLVNINTAPGPVLEALGLLSSLVSKILNFRAGPDGLEGTSDDGVFPEADSIVADLNKAIRLSDPEVRALSTLLQSGKITVQSNVVRLDLTARLNDSRGIYRARLVASGRSSGLRILQWREAGR